MANTTSYATPICSWPKTYGDTATFVTYKIIFPAHFPLALINNVICILAFCRKRKHDTAFGYQLILTVNQMFANTCYALYAVTFYQLSGAAGVGVAWFESCNACMWYVTHLSIPMGNVFFTNSFLITLATSIDRVFAMGKPMVYKNINHKKHQLLATLGCITISVSINIFDSFRFYPVLGPNKLYSVVVDTEFTQSLVAHALGYSRDAVRSTATLVLVVSNVWMVILYKRYVKKVKDMISSNSAEAKRKRAQEKVLVIISISESIYYFVTTISLSAFYAALYAIPTFYECQAPLIGGLIDGFFEVFDLCNFYLVIALSHSFRSMLVKSVPLCVRKVFTSTEAS